MEMKRVFVKRDRRELFFSLPLEYIIFQVSKKKIKTGKSVHACTIACRDQRHCS